MSSTLGTKLLPWYETIMVSIWTILFIVVFSMCSGFLMGSFVGKKYFPLKFGNRSNTVEFKEGETYDLAALISSNSRDDSDEEGEDGDDDVTEDNYKMVLVLRQDLNMTKGKSAAQCCHACLSAFKETIKVDPKKIKLWESQGQPKITLKCNSEEELFQIYRNSLKLGLVARYIQDAGRTQVSPGSVTVLAIGPDSSNAINEITGHLKLY